MISGNVFVGSGIAVMMTSGTTFTAVGSGNWVWRHPVVAKSLEDACIRRMNGENVVGYPNEKGEFTQIESLNVY